jgi:hypothetical protein
MKRCITAIAVFFFVALLVPSCRKQPSPASGKPSSVSSEAQRGESASGSKNTASCDSLLTVVNALENSVRSAPRDQEAAQALAKASFDSSSGCFLAAGKGTFNRSHPQAAWETGRAMSAQLDAKRWALYLKTRSEGRDIVFGENISGGITYSSTMCSRVEGDTLILLVKVPLGSVIVKQ